MGDTTKIQWTDKTFNPWIGCTKVSPGCVNCYAETCTRARVLRHHGQETWGRGAQRSRTSKAYWRQPLAWNAAVKSRRQRRPRVFCASLADWLDDEVPREWLYDLLDLIQRTPRLDWQLLTKRPQNWRARLKDSMNQCSDRADDFIDAWLEGSPPANVWLGTTVEDQARAEERLPELLSIPAHVRFLSCEPLIEVVDLKLGHNGHALHRTIGQDLHWVIVGGESGPGARPCHTDHVHDLVEQCREAGVACFVKQLGSHACGAGRHQPYLIEMQDPKGGLIKEWHPDLRVREFPARAVVEGRAW